MMLIKLGMAGGLTSMLISGVIAALLDTQVGADDIVPEA